jgi:hypothetical protein
MRMANACRIQLEDLEGKRSPWRPRLRWLDNIKMDLKINRF